MLCFMDRARNILIVTLAVKRCIFTFEKVSFIAFERALSCLQHITKQQKRNVHRNPSYVCMSDQRLKNKIRMSHADKHSNLLKCVCLISILGIVILVIHANMWSRKLCPLTPYVLRAPIDWSSTSTLVQDQNVKYGDEFLKWFKDVRND